MTRLRQVALVARPIENTVMALDDGSVIRVVEGDGVVAVDVTGSPGRETPIGGVTIRHT